MWGAVKQKFEYVNESGGGSGKTITESSREVSTAEKRAKRGDHREMDHIGEGITGSDAQQRGKHRGEHREDITDKWEHRGGASPRL